MLQLPFERGEAAVKAFIQAMLDQHHTDIERLKKRMGELNGGGKFSGSGDTSAYNISQQFERFVRLTAPCHSGSIGGSSAAAVVQQLVGSTYSDTTEAAAYPDLAIGANGAVVVNGYFMGGYAFADERVRVKFDLPTGIWLVQDNGHHMVRGTITVGTVTSGGNRPIALDHSLGTVEGYEVLGVTTAIPNSKKVWLTWNKNTSRFEIVSAQC